MDMLRAGNSVKNGGNLLISNPKPDLHNINENIKIGENPLIVSQVIIWKRKYRQMDGQTMTYGLTGWHLDSQLDSIIPHH